MEKDTKVTEPYDPPEWHITRPARNDVQRLLVLLDKRLEGLPGTPEPLGEVYTLARDWLLMRDEIDVFMQRLAETRARLEAAERVIAAIRDIAIPHDHDIAYYREGCQRCSGLKNALHALAEYEEKL